MASATIDAISGVTLYLKPSTNGAPTTPSPWAGDVVNGTWDSVNEQWTFTVTDGASYLVYRRLGGSPANTDPEVGSFTASDASAASDTSSSNVTLLRGSTKRIRHYVVGNNLTGKTLKVYIETKPGTFFAEFNATGGDGYFEFTPSSQLVATMKVFHGSLREPSNGNFVHWNGLVRVSYAADANPS